jgi:hypothetical protein
VPRQIDIHDSLVPEKNVKTDAPPKLMSVAFHTRFFPSLLWSRIRPKQQQTRSGFNSSFELYLVLAGCAVLVALGVPAAMSHGSIAGWMASGLGAAGILAVLANSISSRSGEPLSWDGFLVGIFFFFVFLGLTVGIFVNTLEHFHLFLSLATCTAGLVAGYLVGIIAGLWLQYVGWLATVLNQVAGPAVIGMLVLDMVLLSGALSD